MNVESIPQNFFENLPIESHGFKLEILNSESEKRFNLFRYRLTHREALGFFNEETKEFNLQLSIDLLDFCDIRFIAGNIDRFAENLKNFLPDELKRLGSSDVENLSELVREKKITEWNFDLPARIENFTLEIQPRDLFEIPNGSYLIIDYCDFESESSFSIIYNLFRDEFFCEERIHRNPDINYEFESTSLDELQSKLEEHLVESITAMRQQISAMEEDLQL